MSGGVKLRDLSGGLGLCIPILITVKIECLFAFQFLYYNLSHKNQWEV